MELSNFILHNDILLFHAIIANQEYVFTVKWKALENKKGGEWELKSYLNHSTGQQDLNEVQLQQLIDRLNPTWNFDKDQEQLRNATKND
ncbi:hypothetical protein MUN88_13415 [Gracilibacillus caseinilyticus]|uniref:Uncharacterized protein n=1 Tax=Gracilibacillus caseinilyticus TaxID=2932256 RepID=A0ABY4ERM0_9BACI|nr:hypothetical protein [Gracilibacillus caseinilyticus]UOQ47079.1 hypothetical protein MUN88_13415 [Gracilibacillus caseinilyticus]